MKKALFGFVLSILIMGAGCTTTDKNNITQPSIKKINDTSTYINTKYNFSFTYPNNTKLLGISGFNPTVDKDSPYGMVVPTSADDDTDISINNILGGETYFAFEVIYNPNSFPTLADNPNVSLEQFVYKLREKEMGEAKRINAQDSEAAVKVSDIERKIVNNNEWIGFSTQGYGHGAKLKEPRKDFFTKHNNTFYHIYFDADNQYAENVMNSFKLN